MRKLKQQTREEKLTRQIERLTRFIADDPELKCLEEFIIEIELELAKMSPTERSSMVPWSETRRETKANIQTLNEWISDKQKELKIKQNQTRKSVTELRKCRLKLERRLACLKRMGV